MIGNSKEFVPNRVKAGARCNIGPLREEVLLQEIRIKIHKLSTEVVKCQRWDDTARANSALRLLCMSARPFLSLHEKKAALLSGADLTPAMPLQKLGLRTRKAKLHHFTDLKKYA